MTQTHDRKRGKKPRIQLTDQDRQLLVEIQAPLSVSTLAKQTGLPYALVYNIVHGRVKTISDRHYRMLFHRAPPHREPQTVDGTVFRSMVALWLFLNDNDTKASLYREFYGDAHAQKPDYRIFNGKTRTVEYRLECIMRKKFADAGMEWQQLEQWIDELETLERDDRVPYDRIRPALIFLNHELDVHPSSLLNQSVSRYESGRLKHVSRDIYDRVMTLKQKTEAVLQTGRSRAMVKLKENISGGKTGYRLYIDVEEELQFLRRYARRGVKRYLGRGLWIYTTGRAKRIPLWRARKIMDDCDRFILERPDLRLSVLPRSRQRKWVRKLLAILVARTARLLSNQEGLVFEKRVLRPLHAPDVYREPYHGFTRFDMASSVLGMKQKAFDLMVAKNCEIFRMVGKYARRWYLSDLYLKELSENEFFDLISAKYELMAQSVHRLRQIDACMH